MERLSEVLCSRGVLAPEDLCRLSRVSREWRSHADTEASWRSCAHVVTIRALPLCMEPGTDRRNEGAKESLLQRYRPVYAARRQIRQLVQRIAGFWSVWSASAAAALRPGLAAAELQRLEANGALPEDFAEFLRCCDGYEAEGFWFAEAAPGALAYRVARLLPAQEMLNKVRRWPSGWLPVACSREGALTCLRVQADDESVASFGELWCGAAPHRGGGGEGFETTNLLRQSCSFTEYLQDYLKLLESIPRQFAEEQLLARSSLNQVLPQLFSSTRIYCDEQSSWITTGLGKGKGNLWQRVDRSRPPRIIFPPFGKTGKRPLSYGPLWLNA